MCIAIAEIKYRAKGPDKLTPFDTEEALQEGLANLYANELVSEICVYRLTETHSQKLLWSVV